MAVAGLSELRAFQEMQGRRELEAEVCRLAHFVELLAGC